MTLFLLGSVSLYYSFLAAFPALFACSYPFWLVAVLCGAGGFLSDILNSRWPWKMLGILFPLSALLMGRTVIDYLTLVLPLVFSIGVLLRRDLDLEYYSYRDFFKTSMMIWGFYYLVIFLFYNFESLSGHRSSLEAVAPLKMGILSILCSILLLRTLRLGQEDAQGRRLNRNQMILSVAGISGLLGAFMLLEKIARDHLTDMNGLMERVFINFFGAFFSIVAYIQRFFEKAFVEFLPDEYTTPAVVTETIETVPLPTGGIGQFIPEPEEESIAFPWWVVVLILLALAVLLFFMSRLLSNKQKKYQASEVISDIKPSELPQKEPRRSNRQKVRQQYREYLKKLKHKGVRLRKDMTTLDHLNSTAPDSLENAKKLRDLYLQVRYRDDLTVTTQQVKDAQDAQKKI